MSSNKAKSDHFEAGFRPELPSSTINILLENREYMAMVKEKVAEIKRVCEGLKLAPLT